MSEQAWRGLVSVCLLIVASLAGCLDEGAVDEEDPAAADVGEPPDPSVLQERSTPELTGCDSGAPDTAVHLAPGDPDGDGAAEIFVACPGPDRLLDEVNGTFTDVAAAQGIQGEGASAAAAWGDADGDGCLDLYVASPVSNEQAARPHFYLNDCSDGFVERADEAGLARADPTRAVAWSDYDKDGDLDLYVANGDRSGTPNRLYENGGDGSFTDVAERARVAGSSQTTAVAWLDADLDGHPDLVTASAGEGLTLYRNLGDGTFQDATKPVGLGAGSGPGLDVADVDRDGDLDLYVTGGTAHRLYLNEGDGRFTDVTERAGVEGPAPAQGAAFADLDNDGWEDLVLLPATEARQGPAVYQNQRDGTFEDVTQAAGLADAPTATAGGLVDLGSEGSLDLVLGLPDGDVRAFSNPSPAGRWIEVRFSGNQSNAIGLDTLATVQDPDHPHSTWVTSASGSLATEAGLMHLGAADKSIIDSVELRWSSGIQQVATLVETNSSATIEESPSTKTSCPLVFVRTPEGMRFVSDVLGNSYIGWQYAEDRYMVPDPTERLRLGNLTPVDGTYEVRIMEALEEINYLDKIQLTAVDHAPDATPVPDERFNVAPPHDGYGLVSLVDPQPVAGAWTGDGEDVTALVAERDGESPDVPRMPPPTFDGYAEEHSLVLDLGGTPTDGRLQLAAWGWIYYPMVTPQLVEEGPYIPPKAPTLEALDPATGGWVTVTENPGFPAGMPKWWTLDLTDKLPDDARKLRLTTNLQIHWDQFLVDTAPHPASPTVHRVHAEHVDLHRKGYPAFVDEGPQQPGRYTYDRITPIQPWDVPRGNYTRYGEVAPLLEEADDRFVIFPHGDELTVEFDSDALPPVPEGMERTFFLDLGGFFKDMEEYNAHPNTVEPLPFHGMSNYPYGSDEAYPGDEEHTTYRERWNTRNISALRSPSRK